MHDTYRHYNVFVKTDLIKRLIGRVFTTSKLNARVDALSKYPVEMLSDLKKYSIIVEIDKNPPLFYK